MYNYKQIDLVYEIKKKLMNIGYWDSEYIKCFPGFSFCAEGRYVWQDGNVQADNVFISNIESIYTTDKDRLLESLTVQQYKFLMNNIELFHGVYRIGSNLVVSLI